VEQVALNRHVTPPKRLPMIKRDLGADVKGKMKKNVGVEWERVEVRIKREISSIFVLVAAEDVTPRDPHSVPRNSAISAHLAARRT